MRSADLQSVRKKNAPELHARNGKREDTMPRNRLILILLFVLGTGCAAGAAEDAVVMTEQGQVVGTVTPTLRKFLGIPYAAPPVGDLRWTPPKVMLPGTGRLTLPSSATIARRSHPFLV